MYNNITKGMKVLKKKLWGDHFLELLSAIINSRIWWSVDTCCDLQSNHEQFARMCNKLTKGTNRHNQFILLSLISTCVRVYASSAVHSAFVVGLLNANIIGLSLISAMALITPGVNSGPAPATPVVRGKPAKFIRSKIEQFLPTTFLQ